jgi:ribose 5-phosphate isomerase B
MKIYFATDHAGFRLKEELVRFVRDELRFEVEDMGAHREDPEDDYVDFIPLAARKVSEDPDHAKAIVLGGSGEGEAIVANRFPRVRATVYYGGTYDIPRLSREHNDANILSLGARFVSTDDARAVVKLWLSTPFSGDERHVRRITKLEHYP